VAGPGHVGGDPRDDILIGSPNADAPAIPSVGRSSIHVPGSFSLPLSEWWGTESQQAFGRIVAPLGDRNGDGVQEFATGSPRRSTVAGNGVGEVTIYSGATLQPLSTLSGIMASEEFGSAAAGQGDINRDGVPDLVIGAPRHSNGSGLFIGRVAVFSTPGFGSYGSGLGSLNSMSFSGTGSVAPGGVLMLGTTGGPPSSPAYLGYATTPEQLIVPHPAGTIAVLLDVTQITMGQFFPFNTNVFGDLSLGISAPATGFLNGITLFIQFVAFDQAAGTPAFSDGFSMTFGL